MKVILIELSEVFSYWLKDPSHVTLRVSLLNKVEIVKYQQSVRVEVLDAVNTDQVHILIQHDNIVLGSLIVSLEWMFGAEFSRELDDWVNLEVPVETIMLISKQTVKDVQSKFLRIRLNGKISGSSGQLGLTQVDLNKELKIIDTEENKIMKDHRKMPSEADSLEAEPRTPIEKPEKNIQPKPSQTQLGHASNKSLTNPESNSPRVSPLLYPQTVFDATPLSNLSSNPLPLTPKPSESSDIIKPSLETTESHTEAKEVPSLAVDDSLSLNSSVLSSDNEIKDQPGELSIQRPAKLNLTASSITSPCLYLQNVLKVEWHLKSIMFTLNKLKEDMGGAFLKLVEESTRRDSRNPTRSPSRKLTNSGMRTPLISQRSLNASVISSFHVEESSIVELPATADVFLDRVSIKNAGILANCIVGALAKGTFAAVQLREIEQIKEIVVAQENSISVVSNSVGSTTTEFSQECSNYEILIKRLKDEIAEIETKIGATKKRNQLMLHEKNSCETTLNEVNKETAEIKAKYNANIELDSIKTLKSEVESLNKSQEEIEIKLSVLAANYKSIFDASSATQSQDIKELSESRTELRSVSSTIEELNSENFKLGRELQGLTSSVYATDELDQMLLNYHHASSSNSKSLDSLRSQLAYLRSSKHELLLSASDLHQKIDQETKRVKASQSAWSKEIESYTTTASELSNSLASLNNEVSNILESFTKKHNTESLLDATCSKSKHNQETKDQLMNELFYFSDFVFSLSQTFLHQKRIYEKVKKIVESKEMEVEAMRTAVHELKLSHPVYLPVDQDKIDKALADYFNARDDLLILPFVRESYGVYLYGTRRIMIRIERGRLIVKTGGGFLPIEAFIDTYTEVEMQKVANKPELSQKMKKVMAKWVGGLYEAQDSPEQMKAGLYKAIEGHRFTQAFGVRDVKRPAVNEIAEVLRFERPETPVIEEDI